MSLSYSMSLYHFVCLRLCCYIAYQPSYKSFVRVAKDL